jgi:hypothetical protein
MLQNPAENRDVRIAAADALRNYPTGAGGGAAKALASVLSARDFGVAWQAHESLVRMTGRDLRYMGRRRVNKTDKNGDPLDGVVNLFDVAIILAVAFLLAALAGVGLTDVLSSKDMTIVKNPGQSDMQVIVKQGDSVMQLNLQPGQQVSGVGTLIGQFYQLADGTTVYVPTGAVAPTGSAPTTGATSQPIPGVTPTPGATVPPTPTATP